MAPIFVILLIVALGALGVYLWRQEQARLEALRRWVRSRGWSLDRDRSKGWEKRFPGLKIFGKGHTRHGRNVITGEIDGRPVTLLDYQYTTGHGKNRHTHRIGIVLLTCDFPVIPLWIRREHAFDKVGEFLGSDDIDFESAEFSRRFYVKSSDRKWAYDVIHARTMEYLLRAPKVEIEFGFGEIAVLRRGFCNPDRYEALLEVAHTLYGLIPDYVVQQMKGAKS